MTRWQRSRWVWNTSPSMDASGIIHLQMQRISQSTNWELAVSLTTRKEYIDPHKTWEDEGRKGKRGGEWDWTCSQGVEELKQGWDPHVGAVVWNRAEASEAVGEGSRWSVMVWMGWNLHGPSTQQPSHPGQGCRSSGTCYGWELECGDWRAIRVWTAVACGERAPGVCRGRSRQGRPLEESWAAKEARRPCRVSAGEGGAAVTTASPSPHLQGPAAAQQRKPREGGLLEPDKLTNR